MRGPEIAKTDRARDLRACSSSANEKMWSRLRNRRLGGHKFVREFPIGPFFADFCCRAEKVVVEIDGATHSTAVEIASDANREDYLHTQGYRIFRAYNGDVYEKLDGVCEALLAFMRSEIG